MTILIYINVYEVVDLIVAGLKIICYYGLLWILFFLTNYS